MVAKNPLDQLSHWECQDCGVMISVERVEKILKSAEEMIGSKTGTGGNILEHYEKCLHQLADTLHPNHYILLELKQKLGLFYGNIPNHSLGEMSRPAKERKLQVCHQVLHCFVKLDVFLGPHVTQIQTEMCRTRVALAKDDFSRGLLTRDEFKEVLRDNKLVLFCLSCQKGARPQAKF